MKAVEVLMEAGVLEERIIFVNLVSLLSFWELIRCTDVNLYRLRLQRVSITFVPSIPNAESSVVSLILTLLF